MVIRIRCMPAHPRHVGGAQGQRRHPPLGCDEREVVGRPAVGLDAGARRFAERLDRVAQRDRDAARARAHVDLGARCRTSTCSRRRPGSSRARRRRRSRATAHRAGSTTRGAAAAGLAFERQVVAQLGRHRSPRPDEVVVREDDGAERLEVARDVSRDRDERRRGRTRNDATVTASVPPRRARPAPPDPAARQRAPASVIAAPIPTRYICSGLVTNDERQIEEDGDRRAARAGTRARRPKSSATPTSATMRQRASRTSSRPAATDDRRGRA